MSVKKFRMVTLSDKIEEGVVVPEKLSKREREEAKVKSSKKTKPRKKLADKD
jgi:hypothetical protein